MKQYWLAGLVFVFTTLGLFAGEKIPYGDGLGFDGVRYAKMARELPTLVENDELDRYYVRRVLTPGLIHYTLEIFSIEPSSENLIRSFGILHCLLLTAMAWLWGSLANHLGLGPRPFLLGALGLFANYCVLKWSSYYVVLTDVPGYVFGFLMLYSYLTERPKSLMAATVAAAFIWPTSLFMGLALIAFPRRQEGATAREFAPIAQQKLLTGVAAVLVALALGYGFARYFSNFRLLPNYRLVPADVFLDILLLSMAISVVYGTHCVTVLLYRRIPDIRALRWRALLNAALVAGVVVGTQWLLANEEPGVPTARVIYRMFLYSASYPAVFLVAHTWFFGPLMIFALIHWVRVRDAIQEMGSGLTLAAVMGALLSLYSESRGLVNFWPLLPIAAAVSADKIRLTTASLLLYGGLSLLFSRVWLEIDQEGVFPPDKYYLMSFGSSLSWETYSWQLLSALVAGALILVVGSAGRWSRWLSAAD